MIRTLNITRRFSSTILQANRINPRGSEQCETQQHAQLKTNEPVQMKNPYVKRKQQCLLCKYRITPNYKNFRLLSQFVSRFTGKMYDRHITGLCEKQQLRVELEIKKARWSGLMAYYFRDPKFAHDPQLFDPDRPFRPHRF